MRCTCVVSLPCLLVVRNNSVKDSYHKCDAVFFIFSFHMIITEIRSGDNQPQVAAMHLNTVLYVETILTQIEKPSLC